MLESLSTGTPVVARRTPYNTEVLEDAGLYFDGRDSLAIELSGVESLGDEAWRDRADAVASKLRDEFTWPHVVGAYERLAQAHGR